MNHGIEREREDDPLFKIACALCGEPVNAYIKHLSESQGSITHEYCKNGQDKDGNLKPIGEWLDEIKRFRNEHKRTDVDS
tara:strand:+ start:64 stop:303 length:240 start_codon:yes stop_codon:yes gene_type:complete